MAVSTLAPNVTKLLLENDRVRVFEYSLKPGEKTELHGHSDFVVYPLSSGTLRFTRPDGRGRDVEFVEGQPVYHGGQWHEAENCGDREVRLLVTEIKS